MKRRDFLATGLGAVVAGAAADGLLIAADSTDQSIPAGKAADIPLHPRDIKLCVKPVMANLIHSGVWQGPCRWTSATPEVERANNERRFADWCQQLKTKGLGRAEDVHLLEPAHVTFSENWVLKPDQIAKLEPDSAKTDVFFIIPSGNERSSYEIGRHVRQAGGAQRPQLPERRHRLLHPRKRQRSLCCRRRHGSVETALAAAGEESLSPD